MVPPLQPTSATCPGRGSAGCAQAAVMARPGKQKWAPPPPLPPHRVPQGTAGSTSGFPRVCSRSANRWRRRCRPVPAKPAGAAPSRRRVPPLPSRSPVPGGHSPARPRRQTGCASWRAGRGSLKRDNNIICIFLPTEEKSNKTEAPLRRANRPHRCAPSRPTRPRRGLQPRFGPAVR